MRVCTLASGSSGNAAYIEGDSTSVLVDAGLSGKAIIAGLESIGADPSRLEGILVTHEHADHIKGVGVLSRKFDLSVYATEGTWGEMASAIGEIPEYNRCILEQGKALEIGDLSIEHFETSHDAADSVGFCFNNNNFRVGIATDTGYLTNAARKQLDNCDLVVFEANHDLNMLRSGRYPWPLKQRILSDRGHLSNIAAGHCLASLIGGKTKSVMLAHLSKDNNMPNLAYSTVAEVLAEAGLVPGRDLALEVAPRCHPGTLWELD